MTPYNLINYGGLLDFESIKLKFERRDRFKVYIVDTLLPGYLDAGYVIAVYESNGEKRIDLMSNLWLNIERSKCGRGLYEYYHVPYRGLVLEHSQFPKFVTMRFPSFVRHASDLVKLVCGESNKTFEGYLEKARIL